MNFNQINNIQNYGKVYLAVIDTNKQPRKVFVKYNNENNFLYFSLANLDILVKYPKDFHDVNETIKFYEINLPDEIIKHIQKYGTQY